MGGKGTGYRVRIKVTSQDVPADIVCEIISRALGKRSEDCRESIANSSFAEVYIEREEELRILEDTLKRYGFISYEVEEVGAVSISRLRIKRLTQKISEDVVCELLKEILGELVDQSECKKRLRLWNYLEVKIPQERKKAILDALGKLGYVYVEDVSEQEFTENTEERQSGQVHTEQAVEKQEEYRKAIESPFKIPITRDVGAIIGGSFQPFVYLYYAGQVVLFLGFLAPFIKVGKQDISLLWLMFNADLYFNLLFTSLLFLSIISNYLTFTKRFATALILTFIQLSNATSLFIYTKLKLESIKIYLTLLMFLTSEEQGRKIESIIPEVGPAIKIIIAGSILSLGSLFFIFRKGYDSERIMKEFKELANRLGFGNVLQSIITAGLVLFFFFIALSIHRELESRRKKPLEEDLKSHIGLLYDSVGVNNYQENRLDVRTILLELIRGMDEGRVSPESIRQKIEDYKASQFYNYINQKCQRTNWEAGKIFRRDINCEYKRIQSKFIDILISLYYIADTYREINLYMANYRKYVRSGVEALKYSYSYEELNIKLTILLHYMREMDHHARRMGERFRMYRDLFVIQSEDYISMRNNFVRAYNLKIQQIHLEESGKSGR